MSGINSEKKIGGILEGETCLGIFSAAGVARCSSDGTRIISTSDRSRSAAFVEIRRLAALNRVLESDIRKAVQAAAPAFQGIAGVSWQSRDWNVCRRVPGVQSRSSRPFHL